MSDLPKGLTFERARRRYRLLMWRNGTRYKSVCFPEAEREAAIQAAEKYQKTRGRIKRRRRKTKVKQILTNLKITIESGERKIETKAKSFVTMDHSSSSTEAKHAMVDTKEEEKHDSLPEVRPSAPPHAVNVSDHSPSNAMAESEAPPVIETGTSPPPAIDSPVIEELSWEQIKSILF